MPKEILTLYTKLLVNRNGADEELIDLLSTPDLGIGDPEKVEVTNLQDGTRRYVNGLKDVGDSLEFEFNYITDNYQVLKEIEESKEIYTYKVVLPDKLCFTFDAALSVKITGAAVGEQVKMTINLTPYSTIEVGQYEDDNAGQQGYSTFTIGQSRARSAGTLKLYGNAENPIEELYINDVAQELPTGTINDDEPVATDYEVNPGDIIKIKGGFSLYGTELPINNVVLQNNLTNCKRMFEGCTGLIEAPVMPASITDCSNMFSGCTNLAVMPQQNIDMMNNPPEGLVYNGCCAGCPLVADVIPESWREEEEVPGEYTTFTVGESGTLKVGNISSGSISELYIDNVAQELPTGTSYDNASAYTVESGQKIKIKGSFSLYITTLPINNIVLQNDLEDCTYMFFGCTGLTKAPVIPTTVINCYSMFSYCTNLTEAPIIPSSVKFCNKMFYGCTSLTEAPIIPNSVTNCEYMFGECTSLTEAPVIPNSVTNCEYMFYRCTGLTVATEIPEGVINCEYMFGYCTNLTEAPVIPNSVTNCGWMFEGCTSLTEAPIIPDSVTICKYMFGNCTSLTQIPVIPSSVKDCCLMFKGCTSLTEAAIIPQTVIDCRSMFEGCTSLRTLPLANVDFMNEPPEGLLYEGCYRNCENIDHPIPYDQIPTGWK